MTGANAAQTITSFTSSAPGCGGAAEGQTVTVSGTFTDENVADTHTAVIYWGDGTTTPATIVESDGSGTISGSHAYTDGGLYTITVTLADDDNETDTASASAVITGAGFDSATGTLQVVGTDLGDNVSVNMPDASTYKVHASFLATSGNQKTFAAAGGGKILVLFCGGNDQVVVSSGISITAQMDGGAGNDHLKGGSGHDIMLGGDGDDLLVGGNGRDLMIGGNGADRIVGDPDDDILIAGRTAFDANDAALAAILAEWTSARDYATRTANIRGAGSGTDFDNRLNSGFFLNTEGAEATVSDDEAKDVMTGSSGQDWFFANLDSGVLDKITDLSADEFANDLDFIMCDV